MTARPLTRGGGGGRPAAPVRLVHLGLGNFFRAHQAWYTDRAPDGEGWGYAAFGGRTGAVASLLEEQEGLYSLITRSGRDDRFSVVASISRAHPAADHAAWLDCFASPGLAAVTVTVTEAGYLRAAGGGADLQGSGMQADLAALRRDRSAPVSTAPGRLVAGLLARRAADGGPLALVPCDNLPSNGTVLEEVLRHLAAAVDPSLEEWMSDNLSVVTTVVDRITPRAGDGDAELVAASTGWVDLCPVVAEPFAEWVLSGSFPAGRPDWEGSGARLVADAGPFESRKLWLLNGAHSLLAYAGSILGHLTVPAAAADPACRAWLDDWWAVASAHLDQPAGEVSAYRAALVERFSKVRMADRLARIAEDGSQKLPVRILPVLRAERAAGRPAPGACRVLAAWICHLRGMGVPVRDARADEVVPLAGGAIREAVRRVLGWLGPDLSADADLRSAVVDLCEELARRRRPGAGGPGPGDGRAAGPR